MHLCLVNGFLGSGKTTAIAGACKQLIRKNIKAAVITNDQGNQQVDRAYMQSLLLPNAEVVNGCFCCRYSELEHVIAVLTTKEQPEIIFAESVGSCTDLVATVAKPFALQNNNAKIVITVFADVYLMHSIMKGTSCFIEEAIQYVYKKQLEEADIIVINKTDLLSEDELKYVKYIVETSYADKKIIYMNAYNKKDINTWIQLLNQLTISIRSSLEIDYDVYGAGEAMLAWFDQKISIHTHELVAVKVASTLTDIIHNKIQQAGYTIGHLKFLLSDNEWHKKISYTINGTQEDNATKEIYLCKHIDMLINARVQTSPQLLKQIIEQAIEETMMLSGCRIIARQFSAFKPDYPKPLHRIAT